MKNRYLMQKSFIALGLAVVTGVLMWNSGSVLSLDLEPGYEPPGTEYVAPTFSALTVQDEVGIGTAEPKSPLHVKGDTVDHKTITLSREGRPFDWILGFYQDSLKITKEDVATGVHTDLHVFSPEGNVGIGTTTPFEFATLDVAGTALVQDNFVVGENMGVVGFSSVQGDSAVGGKSIVRGNLGVGLPWPEIDPAQRLDVRGNAYVSGSVGIGTTSPSAKLELRGAWEDLLRLSRGTDDWNFRVSSGGRLDFREGLNNARITIASGGNVGIGTISPAQKLEVSGKSRLSNNANVLQLVGSTHVFQEFFPRGIATRYGYLGYGSSTTENLTLMQQRNASLRLGTNNTTRMTITGAGNVGIGNTNPLQRLHVAGNVRADGFCIGTNCITAWPDGGGSSGIYDTVRLTGKYTNEGGTALPLCTQDLLGTVAYYEHYEPGGWFSDYKLIGTLAVCSYNNTVDTLPWPMAEFRWHRLEVGGVI